MEIPKKIKYYFLLAIIAISAAVPLSALLPQPASALAASGMNTTQKITSFAYFKAVSLCIDKGRLKTEIPSRDEGDASKWFHGGFGDPDIFVGYYIDSGDAMRKCGNLISGALSLWGYNEGNFLKAIGYSLNSDGTEWRVSKDSLKGNFEKEIKSKIYGGQSIALDDTSRYAMVLGVYQNTSACGAKDLGLYSAQSDSVRKRADNRAQDGDTHYIVVSKLVNSLAEKHIYSVARNPKGLGYYHAENNDNGFVSGSCSVSATGLVDGQIWNMADLVTSLSTKSADKLLTDTINRTSSKLKTAYDQFAAGCQSYGCTEKDNAWRTYLTACVKDAYSKTGAEYDTAIATCMSDKTGLPLILFSDAVAGAGQEKDDATNDAEAPTGGTDTDQSDPAGTSCAIEGVGWIVCPVVNFMAGIADSAFTFLSDNFLRVDTGIVSMSSTSPTYVVWSTMRTIANVLFVIAFLVIIFSQLTGQGIANYGIKKILPRIIISAILVNVSFFLCQIAVDLSNILGVSLKSFFEGVGNGLNLYNTATPPSTWQTLTTGILATAVVGAGAVALGTTVLIPMLIGAVLALVMIFFVLILRQMLIVLLIVLAPLAFVAFLLPNTEQWFTKWRKMFTGLLLVFPIIGLLFGASSLVSEVLRGVYAANGGSTIGEVIAAGILVLPLFLLPSILKGSISAAGNIGAKINGIGDRFNRGASSKATNSGVLKSLNNRRSMRRAQVGAGIYEGKNPVSALRSRANRSLNRSDRFNALTGNYGTARGANIEKLEETEVKTAEAAIKLVAGSGEVTDTVQAQLSSAIKKGDVVKARAAQNILMGKGGPGVQLALDTMSASHATGQLSGTMGKELADNIKDFHPVIAKQKSPDLLAWANTGGTGSISAVSAEALTWKKLTATELSGLNDKAFAHAMSSGGVSTSTMDALRSERMNGQLSDAKKEAMKSHVYTPPPADPSAGSPPPAQGSQSPQGTRPPEAPPAPAPLGPDSLQVDHTPTPQPLNENGQAPRTPNSGADS